MAASVFYAPRAIDDLVSIWKWQTQHGSGQAARRRLQKIADAAQLLGETPHVWPNGRVPGTQQRVVEGHVIVYKANYTGPERTGATEVEIVTILAPGQNYP